MGWSIAHLGRADRPTRSWCLIASIIPDADGLTLLGGVEFYRTYHHVLAHNLLVGTLVTLAATRWTGIAIRPVLLTAVSFLAHLVGDYFGSGPGWGIQPFLPFDAALFLCPFAWELNAWPNVLLTVILGADALRIVSRHDRTPLESIHHGLERTAVDYFRLARERSPCALCDAQARVRCHACGRPVCPDHLGSRWSLVPRCATCRPTPAGETGQSTM